MTPEGITRKLIAILSADVKDYTRLMSQDDVGTIRTLTASKEAMEILFRRYRGRVVDATGAKDRGSKQRIEGRIFNLDFHKGFEICKIGTVPFSEGWKAQQYRTVPFIKTHLKTPPCGRG